MFVFYNLYIYIYQYEDFMLFIIPLFMFCVYIKHLSHYKRLLTANADL